MISLAILAISIIAGLALRRFKTIRKLDKAITPVVWLLLLSFGIALGSNQSVMADLSTFGLQAAAITVAGIAGSIGATWIIYRHKSPRK